jgi:hypothetical protein
VQRSEAASKIVPEGQDADDSQKPVRELKTVPDVQLALASHKPLEALKAVPGGQDGVELDVKMHLSWPPS